MAIVFLQCSKDAKNPSEPTKNLLVGIWQSKLDPEPLTEYSGYQATYQFNEDGTYSYFIISYAGWDITHKKWVSPDTLSSTGTNDTYGIDHGFIKFHEEETIIQLGSSFTYTGEYWKHFSITGKEMDWKDGYVFSGQSNKLESKWQLLEEWVRNGEKETTEYEFLANVEYVLTKKKNDQITSRDTLAYRVQDSLLTLAQDSRGDITYDLNFQIRENKLYMHYVYAGLHLVRQ